MCSPTLKGKNHVVPTSSQDEALARDGVSREVPCSALKGERVPPGALSSSLGGGGSSEVREPLLEPGVGTGLTESHW